MTAAVYTCGVLGPILLQRDGEPVPLPRGHQRSLLALLLMAGGAPVSRDRLVDELWGEHPPASAVSALHVHLSKLRPLLGDVLVADGSAYLIAADGVELDTDRFDRLVERSRREPEQAPALLAEALGLFRGEPLCDVDGDGAVAEWRRLLEDKRLQAVVMRVEAELATGGGTALVPELERLVREHPFDERLCGHLMVALYRAGREADALEAYQQARGRLTGELGLEPGEPLARIQQQILSHDLALLSPTPRTPSPATTPARASNLPRPLTRLIGGEAELASLAGLLADPDVRLVTLTGPGGVGKTRLLLELARAHEPTYGDGAVLVRLERLIDPARVSSEIAAAVAQRDQTEGLSDQGLAAYLAGRELLLVLDNFEHVLDAAEELAPLLAGAPGVRAVVSSRAALHLRGEQIFEVEPLALPAGDQPREISESPAVQLFLQSALAVNRHLTVDAPTTTTVAEICRGLDGLPLAIELAASRCLTLSPAEIAHQLSRPLAIGEHALRDLPSRQQTLRGTIAWSYDLLSQGAQVALRACGVFLGGFTDESLSAVLGRPAREDIGELLEASLAQRRGADRYELLELVRAFAGEIATEHGDIDSLRAAHRRHYVELIAPSSVAFDAYVAVGEVAAPLWPEHPNCRMALLDAIEHDDRDAALALAYGMRALWSDGHLRQECCEMIDTILVRFTLEPTDEFTLLRQAVGLDTGGAWQRRFEARAAEVGDRDQIGMAAISSFANAMNSRDVPEMDRLRPVLEGLETPDTDRRVRSWAHYLLSADSYVAGRYAEALARAELNAGLAAELDNAYMRASGLLSMTLARSALDGVLRQPDVAEALRHAGLHGDDTPAVIAMWFAARYAVSIDPDLATRWLVLVDGMLRDLDIDAWPESVLAEETLAALGLTELDPADAGEWPGFEASLAEASAWIATRDPAETAPRTVIAVTLAAAPSA